MYRSLLPVSLIAAVCTVAAAPAPPQGPRLIRLAPQSTAKQVGAFRYRLLPDSRDRTPGNAAPLWHLAGDAFRSAKHKMTNQEFDWARQTPLKNLPRKDAQDLLAHYTGALRLARQAACRERCDWELPPLTYQSIQGLPLDMLQNCRFVADLLGIQYRLQLLEGRYDAAAETLQTGFALARHLCEGDLLIQGLVGIAIDAIMFGHVEEWVQMPGSPNLYWPLTALPRPLGNLRHCMEYEWNYLHRSFPRLRRLHQETLTIRQAEDLVKEVFGVLSKMMGDGPRAKETEENFRKLRESILAGESYPQARQQLLDLGRSAKEIDALPKTQVILLWYIDQHDRAWDDVFKALTLPMWQATPLMEATLEKNHTASDPLLALILPTINKTWFATRRIERQLAGLRCAEALRLYAARHEGKPPVKWSDITEVPLPIDPPTGKGFDNFYELKEGRGIMEVSLSALPGMPASLRRRYELAPPH